MEDNKIPVNTQSQNTTDVNQPQQPLKPQFQTSPKEKKSGKGKKVVAVLFVLLLIAGAGYGGYNYAFRQALNGRDAEVAELEKKIAELEASARNSESDELSESIGVKDYKNTYTVQYPRGWTAKVATNKPEGYPADWVSQSATITSPSGEVLINLGTGISGLGGACQKEDNITLKTLQIRGLPSFAGHSLMYFDISKDGFITPTAAVFEDKVADKTKVGGNYCDVYLSDFLSLDSKHGANSFSISSKSFADMQGGEKGSMPTSEQIQKFFESDEFQTAVKILQTLKKS